MTRAPAINEGVSSRALSRAPRKSGLRHRHGYALMLVMLFVAIFGAMLGVAWRRVASAIRVENTLSVRVRSDQGSIQALDLAMRVLETRLRKDASAIATKIDFAPDLTAGTPVLQASPCMCKVQLNVSDNPAEPLWQWYKVVFTRVNDNVDGTAVWSIGVSVAQPSETLTGYLPMPTNPP